MNKITKSNVAYDLTISPHIHEVKYNDSSIQFNFSSDFYKTNFLKRLEDNREKINNSISKRFGMKINLDMVADLKLYSSIEKRGFLIYHNGVAVEWLEKVELDGNYIKMI